MTKIACLLSLLAITLPALAQDVFSNQTNAALQKVIQDYPNHFRNIKGDRLSDQSYKSKVEIPGATNCVLTSSDNNFSWSCELASVTEFDAARKQFQESYSKIRNTIVKIDGEKPFILNGRYEAPQNSTSQPSSVVFELLPAPPHMQQLKVELVLNHTDKWRIVLQVYDKKDAAVQTLTSK
ncbi:MAG: hypothetical protein QM731_20420 [Chitinophagaceae bacterium]